MNDPVAFWRKGHSTEHSVSMACFIEANGQECPTGFVPLYAIDAKAQKPVGRVDHSPLGESFAVLFERDAEKALPHNTPLYAAPQPAPSAFDPEAVAAAIAQAMYAAGAYLGYSNNVAENSVKDVATQIAGRCLPADEREGWLKLCGVVS